MQEQQLAQLAPRLVFDAPAGGDYAPSPERDGESDDADSFAASDADDSDDGGATLLAERSPGGRRVNFADSFAPGSSELGSEAEDDDGSLASSESFGGASRDPREGAAARARARAPRSRCAT